MLTILLRTALLLPLVSACTNLLIGKKASRTGSPMIAYTSDAGWQYGGIGHYPARKNAVGAMRDVWNEVCKIHTYCVRLTDVFLDLFAVPSVCLIVYAVPCKHPFASLYTLCPANIRLPGLWLLRWTDS